ncbi:HI0074 family nucleotidyltransferase substrate-binding subunit [Caldisalinibacter kiritimatiensis]|uniref:Nucleotidyltransferase n=1 Tax=Caldisalinibacter kiritimatiensis TaxID=1304284 RepID=R1ARU8_9FIRM|nr:HI0074 family nucleotidyltransferase substrate-binding subunit [Caldisalinibacter kiritimatiensis]EOC99386.1 Nucleotidyltransferase [Caldisalinibacter kiritimatiensis]
MKNRYGLSKNEFYNLINILKSYSRIIEKVILFGSRARGDYKQTSDIDIAIKFRGNNDKIYNIKEDIAKQNIIYTFDIVDYDKVQNEKLKKYIDNEGKIIFLTNKEGEVMVTINKIKDKIEDLKKAFKKLEEVMSRDYFEDDIVLDAGIQRFEFTYELSWKLMKVYLEYNGNLEATSPRKAIKEAFKEGLIKDGQIWLKMLDDRNKTSHSYEEENAIEIFNNVKSEYIYCFEKFIDSMEREISVER